MQMMDILTNTANELETKPNSKSREEQRRAKQRSETAEPKDAQRRKLMASIAVAERPQQHARGKGKRKKRKPKPEISKPIVVTDYMTTMEAAAYLKLSRQFLEAARYRGDGSGPSYLKIGRAVRYRKPVLDAWMAKHDHAADKPIQAE